MPQQWGPYAKPGPYVTRLSPDEETKFKSWISQEKVPWQDAPTSDYDMRGYWKAMVSGSERAHTSIDPEDKKPHYPDIWKTPYHKTFSRESQYALPTAGHWEGGRFVPPDAPRASQDSYVQLPDGNYVQIPRGATPEQLNAFKERLRSFTKRAGISEAEQVEKRPNVTAQAREQGTPVALRPGEQAQPQPEKGEDWLQSRARTFSEAATGAGTIPEFVKHAWGGVKKLRSEGPISMASDFAQSQIDAMNEAMGKYGLSDPKRYVAAIPFVGPSLARGEELGGSKGIAHDLGLATGAAIMGKAPEAAASTWAETQALKHIFSDPKLSMQQASQMLADTISKEELSPRQFGANLQEGFDQISKMAGAGKGEFVTRVAREHPDITVNYSNMLNALETDVNNLRGMKARNPDLFAQGEAMDRTLRILESELKSTHGRVAGIKNSMVKGNLPEADLIRSQLWNYKQQLDPSMASRVIGTLDKAITDDIKQALPPNLAQEYIGLSTRYHELQNLGRMNTLKSVFGNKRVTPSKVVEVLNQVPEDSVAAVRSLTKDNPAAIQNLRRALFEQSLKTAGAEGLFKLQPSLVREIYGPQAEAVSRFIDVVNTKAAKGNSLLSKIPGKGGDLLRIMESRNRPGITIKASEMAKILRSSEMTRLFTQAAEMPANAGPAAMLRDTLERAIKAADIQPEAVTPKSRRPIWAEERRVTEGQPPEGVVERRGEGESEMEWLRRNPPRGETPKTPEELAGERTRRETIEAERRAKEQGLGGGPQ